MGWVMAMSMGAAEAKVVERPVTYKAGSTTMRGTLAHDEAAKGDRPGILVVPEWWGVNDYTRRRAKELAELGYIALTVDMYGEGRQADDPQAATKMSTEVIKDLPLMKQRFEAALDFLKKQKHVSPHQIAAIGYCFGGGVVLNMARAGEELVGVVSFHGNLTPLTPARPGQVHARILVCQGGDDSFAPPDQVDAFRREMSAAGVKPELIVYPGAKHAFTNPAATELGQKFKLPIAYDQAADKKSWADMRAFFASIFGK
jgi:dienelactone hydrolase